MELSVIPPESQIQQTGIKSAHIPTRNPRMNCLKVGDAQVVPLTLDRI